MKVHSRGQETPVLNPILRQKYQVKSINPTSLRSILILSSHLCLTPLDTTLHYHPQLSGINPRGLLLIHTNIFSFLTLPPPQVCMTQFIAVLLFSEVFLEALRGYSETTISGTPEWAGIVQSVWRLARGWTVQGSNPGTVKIFRTRSERPWGPLSLLYNGYWLIPWGKATHPHLVPR